MTSRPSSISSSEGRRYLGAFALGTVLLLGAIAGISAFGYAYGLLDASNRALYQYQLGKIRRMPQIDVAFIGDSSLGNAIDAALFSDLAGAPAANLALSGSYGLGGSYNMIRHTLTQHPLRVAIVMQALKTFVRRDAESGYFFTGDGLDQNLLSPIDVADLYLNFRTVKEIVQQIRRKGLASETAEIVDDYYPQLPMSGRLPAAEEAERDPLHPAMVSDAQIAFIRRIAVICRANGLTCLYAHGPIYEAYCRSAQPYIARLNGAIESAGLTVVAGTPICMPLDQLGNTVDHVAPVFKDAYTRRYFALLAPYLGRLRAAAQPN